MIPTPFAVTPRPPIFISAVSRELRSARQLVANTLTFLGYQPVWQDTFGTEGGDLRGVLRHQIDQCKGVVQLIGNCYGAEPPAPDEEFGRVSYTQYEALYARKRGKKIWYLFIDETFPADPHDAEPPELAELQQLYRRGIKSDAHLFHPLASREALEASVLKLRDDLTRLRRGVKQWAAAVGILLAVIAVSVFWLLRTQHQTKQEVADTKLALTEMTEEMKKLRQSVVDYPKVEAKVRQSNLTQQDPAAVRDAVYSELSKERKVDPAVLREKLPQVAEQLKSAADASGYERATAAYVSNDFVEAERLALSAADEAQKASPPNLTRAVEAFQLAGWSAQARIEYATALKHFRQAERLTDRNQDAWAWAMVQSSIGLALWSQGQYQQAETALRDVLAEAEKIKGPADPDTLLVRQNLAAVFSEGGKSAEAETELRSVLALGEKTFGPEDPFILGVRMNLAASLTKQRKFPEAEKESQAVLALSEKVLGPEHLNTLKHRLNLAILLAKEGRYAEGEDALRAVIKLLAKVAGPEHPDTLYGRMMLAFDLSGQGKFVEAETETRDVLSIQERVLGPEHPTTLKSRCSLALCLFAQEKKSEALPLVESNVRIARKVLGPDHPDTKVYESLNAVIAVSP